MKENECPYCEKCPIYGLFCTDTSREAIVLIYCTNDFEKCERKKLRDQGLGIPEKLLPNGQYLD
ncbi:MAG: hypothetical protein WC858_00490 [Parcubacteria group bacterium]